MIEFISTDSASGARGDAACPVHPSAATPLRLPDFVIIGAAKAGTTSLHRALSQHPDIFMSTPKEPEFFARDDRYAQGIETYARLFAGAAPGQICGEASTLYSLSPLFPQTPARMKAHLPEARLIYVLREPVARSYSYYMQLTKGRQNATREPTVPRSFEECLFPQDHPHRAPREKFFAWFNGHLPDDPELLLAGSDYPAQIRAYLGHFSPAQMHFVLFEDLVARPGPTLAGILRFLGLDPDRLPSQQMARSNISADHFARFGEEQAIVRWRHRLGPLYAPARMLPAGLKSTVRRILLRGSRPATTCPPDAACDPCRPRRPLPPAARRDRGADGPRPWRLDRPAPGEGG